MCPPAATSLAARNSLLASQTATVVRREGNLTVWCEVGGLAAVRVPAGGHRLGALRQLARVPDRDRAVADARRQQLLAAGLQAERVDLLLVQRDLLRAAGITNGETSLFNLPCSTNMPVSEAFAALLMNMNDCMSCWSSAGYSNIHDLQLRFPACVCSWKA